MKKIRKTTVLWDAKLDFPAGASAPDSYDGSNGLVPPDDFVVARDRKGHVVSRYSDLEWNISAYHPRGRSCWLRFRPWGKGNPTRTQRPIVREMRWLMFALIWKRHGASLSAETLQHYMVTLRSLAQFAHDNGCRVKDILGDAQVMRRYIEMTGAVILGRLPALLITLMRLGEAEVGFPVLGGTTITELRAIRRECLAGSKQHPPIPTRIYSILIANTVRELAEFEAIADEYLRVVTLFAAYLDKAKSGQAKKPPPRSRPTTGETRILRSLLQQHGLVEYFRQKNLSSDRGGLMHGLSDIREICQLAIHIYSGARKQEIQHLPFICLDSQKRGGKVDYLLHGYTTKLNNGRLKAAQWVTSKEGAHAIRIAQKVASIIYQRLGEIPKKESTRTDQYPLFVSVRYLPFGKGCAPRTARGRYAPAGTRNSNVRLLERLLPTIEEQDLRELEQIDPHRAWRSEPKFQMGKRWSLTKHQLRRSLALYASISGLVTLPSLRRQLQHITEAMSRYYARGSQLAKSIIGSDKKHFGLEYQDAQPETQALAYVASVLFSDGQLFGAHGIWVERHRKPKGEVRILDERKKTLTRFKKGELAWKETMLGGCAETGPCDKKAMRSMVGCIDCKSAVLKLSKVSRVVAAQENLLTTLDPSSIEYRTEMADLQILQAAKASMEGQTTMKELKHVTRKERAR